jgi:dihydrofolate reductase
MTPARRLRYHVAVSLDGFIADADGGYDWIVHDSAIDFRALHAQFDTAIMGRKTYDLVKSMGGDGAIKGMEVYVFSRTLAPSTRPGVRIVDEDAATFVSKLKAQPGGDIWLFGGGELFRALHDAGLVDTVEVAVMPVLIGSGIPLMPAGTHAKLVLGDHQVLPASGIIALSYAIEGHQTPSPSIAYVKPPKKRT